MGEVASPWEEREVTADELASLPLREEEGPGPWIVLKAQISGSLCEKAGVCPVRVWGDSAPRQGPGTCRGPACLRVGTLGRAVSRKCPRALGIDADLLVPLIGRESAYSDLVSVLHHDKWASQLSLLWAGGVGSRWAEAYNTHPTVYEIDNY